MRWSFLSHFVLCPVHFHRHCPISRDSTGNFPFDSSYANFMNLLVSAKSSLEGTILV